MSLALLAALLLAACSTVPAQPLPSAPRAFTGFGIAGRWVCVDTDTGALYLLTKCDAPGAQ